MENQTAQPLNPLPVTESQPPVQPVVDPVSPTPPPSQPFIPNPPPPTPTTPPNQPKKSFSFGKSLILIIVLILIVALPLGTYVLIKQIQTQPAQNANVAKTMNALVSPTLTPTPTLSGSASGTLVATDTATWKTYTNTKYNYSIKYPSNWQPLETNSIQLSPLTKTDCTTFQVPTNVSFTNIVVICHALGSVLSEFNLANNPKAKLVTIGNYQAYRGLGMILSGEDDVIPVSTKSGTFFLTGTYTDNGLIFNTMLESFKFTQ